MSSPAAVDQLPTELPPKPYRTWRGWLIRRGAMVVGIYLLVIVMFAGLQRSLIYHPTKVAAINPREYGFTPSQVRPVEITTHDGLTLHGWHVLPRGKEAFSDTEADERLKSDPVVLYFCGNGGHRAYRDDEFRLLSGLGAHVFVFDYRGYGDNPGKPTEADVARDNRAAWDYVTKTRSIPGSRVLLFGESLGGAMATRLAAEVCQANEPPGGLILRSTFSELADVAADFYPWLPVRLLLVDRFASTNRIPQVTCPILQMHGLRDRVVHYKWGTRLFAAAPLKSTSGVPKTWVDLPNSDHNDVLYRDAARVEQALREFLKHAR